MSPFVKKKKQKQKFTKIDDKHQQLLVVIFNIPVHFYILKYKCIHGKQ